LSPSHFQDALCGTCLSGLAARAEDTDALIAKGDQFDNGSRPKKPSKNICPRPSRSRTTSSFSFVLPGSTAIDEATRHPTRKAAAGVYLLEFANHAAALAPNNAEAQLSPAISLGNAPLYEPKDQFNAQPRIKAAVDRALVLDPTNDNACTFSPLDRVLANVNVVKRVLAKTLYGELPVTTTRRRRNVS